MPSGSGGAGRPRIVHADETAFGPVRTGNAFEEAVERILGAIKLGVIPRGERLPPERELATRLNVSRMTLREALRSLKDANYVETRRGRHGGTFVVYEPPRPRKRSRRDVAPEVAGSLADALALRSVLEAGAAELGARR